MLIGCWLVLSASGSPTRRQVSTVVEADKKPKEDDPDQSERFAQLVRDLEAAEKLSPEPEADFDRRVKRVLPVRKRRKQS